MANVTYPTGQGSGATPVYVGENSLTVGVVEADVTNANYAFYLDVTEFTSGSGGTVGYPTGG